MRAPEKKKAYRLMIATQLRKGLINRADGQWETASSERHGSMGRDGVAGARHGNG